MAAFDTRTGSVTIPAGQTPEPPGSEVQIDGAFVLTLRDRFRYTVDIEFQADNLLREIVLYRRHGEWKRDESCRTGANHERQIVLNDPEGEWLITGWHKEADTAESDWKLSNQVGYATSSVPIETLTIEFEASGERTKVIVTAPRLPLS